MMHDFLPMSREDMEKRGWDQCDFVYVCGDAYVEDVYKRQTYGKNTDRRTAGEGAFTAGGHEGIRKGE